jgi:hypothetical protein
VVTQLALDQGRVRLESAEPPGIVAGPNQCVDAMTIGREAPDQVRTDPSRRTGNERRRAIGVAVSDS